ncbi:cell wall-binding repeat-containing protein [Clostridium thailandense]|uniref:cell wall-binding repeat-containing protein n=1 Tax=Clostridium thailandense TaxID=2794346 RepID=UPI00398A2117
MLTSFSILQNFFIIFYKKEFADALSGSAMAAMGNSPIILMDKSMEQDTALNIRYNKDNFVMKYILGGEGVMPEDLISEVLK